MNKRELKSFIRLDYQKRRVPGSLVLRKSMPKNGVWVEVEAYLCCNGTTGTTTTQYCEGPLCNTVLTVGSPVDGTYGYYSGVFGQLSPDCSDTIGLYWQEGVPDTLQLYVGANYGNSVVVEIDGAQYTMSALGSGPPFWYYFLQLDTNPFPAVGLIATMRICGTEVTTTTTTTEAETTTTTTTCVPEGGFLGITSFSSNYTPTVGIPISFIGSEEQTCAAILVVEANGGQFNYIDVDVYIVGETNHYYLSGTCTELPDGYYVIDIDGYIGEHVTDGVIDEYNVCATTTTTTTLPI